MPFYYHLDHYGWSPKYVTFATLSQHDIRPYLKRNRIITKLEDDDIIMNERNLIANRLLRENIFIDDTMSIYPKHRSAFGVDWIDRKIRCYHLDQDSNASVSTADCRLVKLSTGFKIEGFPVGGR